MRAVTATGWTTACVSLTAAVAGTLLNYPELLAIGLTGLSAVVLALFWLLDTSSLEVRQEFLPHRIVDGERAELALTVRNSGRRTSRAVVLRREVSDESIVIRLPRLSGGERHREVSMLPAMRRGVHVLPPVEITRSDPLSLVCARTFVDCAEPLVVLPRTHYMSPLPKVGTVDRDGSTSGKSRLGGVAFHSLREYVPGDDWRLIHWMSTARAGTLIVRHLVVPDETSHVVLLDTRATCYIDDEFEDAVRVAASWCEAAVGAGCPVSLFTGGEDGLASVPVSPVTRVLDDVLTRLAGVETDSEAPGLAKLAALPLDAGASVGVVTGSRYSESLAALAELGSKASALAVAVVGTDRVPAAPGIYAVAGRDSAEVAAAWNAAA